jgi:hypothetical protein
MMLFNLSMDPIMTYTPKFRHELYLFLIASFVLQYGTIQRLEVLPLTISQPISRWALQNSIQRP